MRCDARIAPRCRAAQGACRDLAPLAQLWPAPRLVRLRRDLGDIDISLTALEEQPDLKRTALDICLFYGRPGPGRVMLTDEQLLPVCAPALAARLAVPEDLAGVNCISDVAWQDWRIWLAWAMPGVWAGPRGPGCSPHAIVVQEALAGAGVLMGRRALVQPCLDNGALVAPFDLAVPPGRSVTAWILPESRHDAAVASVLKSLGNS